MFDWCFRAAPMRHFCAIFFGTAVALAAIVTVQYVQDCQHEKAIREAEGEHLIALEGIVLAKELAQVQADLLYLSQQNQLQALIAGEQETRSTIESDYVRFCRHKAMYDQVRFLDLEGREVIRVNYRNGSPQAASLDELQEKTGRYYFQQAQNLACGEILVSPFDLNVEHEVVEQPLKPVIRFLTPVCCRDGERCGYLVLNFLGQRLLERLQLATRTTHGSLELLNSRGEYILAAAPEDAWGWMLGHDRSFRKQHPQAWDMIRLKDVGQLMAEDHLFSFQHLPIGSRLSQTHSVSHQANLNSVGDSADATDPEPGLVLVAKISQEDLYLRSAKTLRQQIFVYLGALCILAAMAWRLAKSAGLRKLDADRIAASEMRLRQLSTQLLTTQEEERRRISRDLHDELGQQATAIQLDLKSAIAAKPAGAVDALIRRAVTVNDQLIKNLHAIASRIRPSVLDDLGLQDAVESYLDEYAARTGIQVTFHLLFHRANVPAAIGENTYRILQESLANAAKHSRASSVTVTLSVSDTKLELIVRDHGVGGDVEEWSSERLGILGMRERAELLQGRFRISSRPGLGTEVVVTIPLPSESE